ncbi:hypothetical protein FGO68_gene8145 [Halteria grandinella]|uniref:Uncharacterized protein n=1 Tax=Halteria grandinella TaxID=5974 RepID=A0A8J8NC18_HALGN|nr:hypothetical protein FGO68_gene8145 [Halteria grandinella]
MSNAYYSQQSTNRLLKIKDQAEGNFQSQKELINWEEQQIKIIKNKKLVLLCEKNQLERAVVMKNQNCKDSFILIHNQRIVLLCVC